MNASFLNFSAKFVLDERSTFYLLVNNRINQILALVFFK